MKQCKWNMNVNVWHSKIWKLNELEISNLAKAQKKHIRLLNKLND
jgi:hypothetical protein